MRLSKKGFTLIELLVVIAIIGILTALIFPVFARAREMARRAVCLSNIKQLGMAMRMYADDWDGRLPYLGCIAYSAYEAPVRLTETLDGYLGNRDVWHCPSGAGPVDYAVNCATSALRMESVRDLSLGILMACISASDDAKVVLKYTGKQKLEEGGTRYTHTLMLKNVWEVEGKFTDSAAGYDYWIFRCYTIWATIDTRSGEAYIWMEYYRYTALRRGKFGEGAEPLDRFPYMAEGTFDAEDVLGVKSMDMKNLEKWMDLIKKNPRDAFDKMKEDEPPSVASAGDDEKRDVSLFEPHPPGATYVFLDGHAKWLRSESTVTPPDGINASWQLSRSFYPSCW